MDPTQRDPDRIHHKRDVVPDTRSRQGRAGGLQGCSFSALTCEEKSGEPAKGVAGGLSSLTSPSLQFVRALEG